MSMLLGYSVHFGHDFFENNKQGPKRV